MEFRRVLFRSVVYASKVRNDGSCKTGLESGPEKPESAGQVHNNIRLSEIRRRPCNAAVRRTGARPFGMAAQTGYISVDFGCLASRQANRHPNRDRNTGE